MLKLVLLFLTLSGVQAAPLTDHNRLQRISSTFRLPNGFRQGTERSHIRKPIPDDFRQGTEPSRRFIVNLNTGQVQDHISEMERRVDFIRPSHGNGFGEMKRRHRLEEVPVDVPAQRSGDGWVRVEKPSAYRLPDGFRQGTEPIKKIQDSFRQGTEPIKTVLESLRQGAEPIKTIPDGFRQGTEPIKTVLESLRQGAEPIKTIPDGFRQGTEPIKTIPDGFRQGTEPLQSISASFREGIESVNSIPDGFRQGTEPIDTIPEGFRQGTEPMMPASKSLMRGAEPVFSIPAGFWQGTEPIRNIPEGFRQGTEPVRNIPEGFRQGTEPVRTIPEGFRQGTEPVRTIPEGFRQGTEPIRTIPEGFRQGTEPIRTIPEVFRQGTEPSTSRVQTQTVACKGDVINGNCYEFNPTPLAFHDAQVLCRALAPNAELASVTSGDLHSRLVSLVTKGGKSNPVLTWLGGTVKNQKASWVDGSEWSYSDWMPGHPNIHTEKAVCVEMFKIDQSWWTAVDCEVKRASICSYSITA
ncbi:uncharacterized protein LOC117808099 [Notolabrus celidotus]|uniref:uncharacterized protein LOC117808099 n=1 Tax=Notolabrus celidotus TaxID=1203425 RepID=UPI00148FF8EE|nr:uncharacterized protein LOC117808099 [Notolabrus celidotus]